MAEAPPIRIEPENAIHVGSAHQALEGGQDERRLRIDERPIDRPRTVLPARRRVDVGGRHGEVAAVGIQRVMDVDADHDRDSEEREHRMVGSVSRLQDPRGHVGVEALV